MAGIGGDDSIPIDTGVVGTGPGAGGVSDRGRICLSLTRKRKAKEKEEAEKRFAFTTSPNIQELKQKRVPKNTEKSTQWALRCFNEWKTSRIQSTGKGPPDDIFSSSDISSKEVCKWLCHFFSEVRKADGSKYCPRSLSSLLAGLQRHIENISPTDAALRIQSSEGEFKPLHTLLDNLYKDLHTQGIGTSTVQSEVVSFEEEKQLWESGSIGVDNPESLLNAVFFYNGINFILRGGSEHRNLSVSQLKFGTDSINQMQYVEYSETGSKNRPGGSKQLNLTNKNIRHFSQPQLGERCHVHLLQVYISKLPPAAISADLFYCRPLKKYKENVYWYSSAPLGHNTLDKKLKQIFTQAGISSEGKSNHSLRSTSISRLYHAGIPEKVIMEHSGHLSKEGVRSYERTSNDQLQDVSKTLANFVPAVPEISPSIDNASACNAVAEKKNSNPQETSISDPASSINNATSTCNAELKNSSSDKASDILKQLNFQGMSECTFNISLNFK